MEKKLAWPAWPTFHTACRGRQRLRADGSCPFWWPLAGSGSLSASRCPGSGLRWAVWTGGWQSHLEQTDKHGQQNVSSSWQHTTPNKHAGCNLEVVWLWPVMANIRLIWLTASSSVLFFPKKAQTILCKTDPDPIWMTWSGFRQMHLVWK